MREKDENKKKETESDKNRRCKYEEKQVRGNEESLRGLDSCEYLVCSDI